jgi:HlyD family secretion protein
MMVSEASTGSSSAKSFPKSSGRRSWLLALAALLAIGGPTAYWVMQSSSSPQASESAETTTEITTVTALGRLEPAGEVIVLSAPTSTNESRIDQLLVQEGDRVKAGQVIAILDSRDRLQAALERASEQVRVAQAELARVEAGAQTGEIAAQQAVIARLETERSNNIAAQAATVARLDTELQIAQTEYQRYQSLYEEGAISASERDAKFLSFDAAQKQLTEAQANLDRIESAQQQQLNEARATLDRIQEVRPVDVQVAAANVRDAEAAVRQAEAELQQAYVRAPQAGQILKVHTRPGELISNEDGIVEIGQTEQMYAIAEVYQSDIGKVQVGQPARITSESLPDIDLTGTVESIGSQIERQNVINADPSDNIDSRIVETRIRLDQRSSQRVENLTNLQVKVVIEQ